MTDESITWDDATKNTNYVALETDEEKIVVIQNWKFVQRPMDAPIAKGEIEFVADCIEEDGEKIEKQFTTTSKRLKLKLRPLLEDKDNTKPIKISILRIGAQFNIQYSIKEITD